MKKSRFTESRIVAILKQLEDESRRKDRIIAKLTSRSTR